MIAAIGVWFVVPRDPQRHAATSQLPMPPCANCAPPVGRCSPRARWSVQLRANDLSRYLLQQSYAVEFSTSLALLLVAPIVGNLVGGQLADRHQSPVDFRYPWAAPRCSHFRCCLASRVGSVLSAVYSFSPRSAVHPLFRSATYPRKFAVPSRHQRHHVQYGAARTGVGSAGGPLGIGSLDFSVHSGLIGSSFAVAHRRTPAHAQ
jgi:hypothetical protein